MKARGSEDLDLTRKGGRKRLVLHGPSSLWISGGSAAEPKHNPAPTNESTQSSPRGATAGIPPPKKKKTITQVSASPSRLFTGLCSANNLSGVLQSPPESWVCVPCGNGFQFGTPPTHTHTLLPDCSPSTGSPSNSQQAQRQTGQADCSTQQLEPGRERRGRDHQHTQQAYS